MESCGKKRGNVKFLQKVKRPGRRRAIYGNIRNLIIDALEDVTPDTIIIHVSTNDISSGKSINTIKMKWKV